MAGDPGQREAEALLRALSPGTAHVEVEPERPGHLIGKDPHRDRTVRYRPCGAHDVPVAVEAGWDRSAPRSRRWIPDRRPRPGEPPSRSRPRPWPRAARAIRRRRWRTSPPRCRSDRSRRGPGAAAPGPRWRRSRRRPGMRTSPRRVRESCIPTWRFPLVWGVGPPTFPCCLGRWRREEGPRAMALFWMSDARAAWARPGGAQRTAERRARLDVRKWHDWDGADGHSCAAARRGTICTSALSAG